MSVQIQELLQTVPFLSQVSLAQRQQLAQQGKVISVPAQQRLFSEGDEADCLYVILSGEVRVDGQAHDGAHVTLSTLGAGQFFGELALADGGTRSASVVTLSDCTFFTLQRQQFTEVLTSSPELISDVIAAISSKIRSANTNFFKQVLEKQELRLKLEREKHRAVARMVTGVAHEINTPLGIVNTLHSMLAEELNLHFQENEALDREGTEQALRMMQNHIRRLHNLVLTFKHLSAQQLGEDPEWVELVPQLRLAHDVYRLSGLSELQVSLKLDPALNQAKWFGYPTLLDDCLSHLMSNVEAHAYAEQPGPQKVEWRLEPAQLHGHDAFKLSICDWGQGMTAETREQAVEAFFTTRRDHGHTGLGLAIVFNMLNHVFGGRLQIHSSPAAGCCIELLIPFQSPLEEPVL